MSPSAPKTTPNASQDLVERGTPNPNRLLRSLRAFAAIPETPIYRIQAP